MQRLFLMRHAQARPGPDQDEAQLFSTADEPLTERGRRQAHRMGDLLAEASIEIEGVHTSPAIRCRQTAAGVEKALASEHEIREHEDLLEVPYHDPGASYDEILETIVDTARRLRHEEDPSLPSGTSWQEATGRFADAIEAIREEAGNHLVVAHGAQNRAWLTSLLAMPPHRLFFLEQDHACLNVIAYGDVHPVVQKLNVTADRLETENASLAETG